MEGQSLDMIFEEKNEVSEEEYLKIENSCLSSLCLKNGGHGGGATETDAQFLYNFGINLGIAFQIQMIYLMPTLLVKNLEKK